MATTTYTVIDGEIVHENRAGIQHDYVPDPLGSAVATVNSGDQAVNAYRYKPLVKPSAVARRTPAVTEEDEANADRTPCFASRVECLGVLTATRSAARPPG